MPAPSPWPSLTTYVKDPLPRLRAVVCVGYREAVEGDRSVDPCADLGHAKTVVLRVGVVQQQMGGVDRRRRSLVDLDRVRGGNRRVVDRRYGDLDDGHVTVLAVTGGVREARRDGLRAVVHVGHGGAVQRDAAVTGVADPCDLELAVVGVKVVLQERRRGPARPQPLQQRRPCLRRQPEGRLTGVTSMDSTIVIETAPLCAVYVKLAVVVSDPSCLKPTRCPSSQTVPLTAVETPMLLSMAYSRVVPSSRSDTSMKTVPPSFTNRRWARGALGQAVVGEFQVRVLRDSSLGHAPGQQIVA